MDDKKIVELYWERSEQAIFRGWHYKSRAGADLASLLDRGGAVKLNLENFSLRNENYNNSVYLK